MHNILSTWYNSLFKNIYICWANCYLFSSVFIFCFFDKTCFYFFDQRRTVLDCRLNGISFNYLHSLDSIKILSPCSKLLHALLALDNIFKVGLVPKRKKRKEI